MTILCAMYDPKEDGVWIASDSQRTMWDTRFHGSSKWTKYKNWAIGSAGDVRFSNLVDKNWQEIIDNIMKNGQGIYEIVAKLKELMLADGFKINNDDFPKLKQFPLITDAYNIWRIDSVFAFSQVPHGEIAFNGSGWPLALGAAWAAQKVKPDMKVIDLVTLSVSAAIENDIFCGGKTYTDFLPSVKKKAGKKK